MEHPDYMQRALDLAQLAEGRTSPNPMVGAVLVKNGRIIGEGYHHKSGQPHAEVEALRNASESPVGATIYVSLEPCSFFGKTPPCTQAIIEAGIAEVYYAARDLNPKVAGGGHAQLTRAGIQVSAGLLEQDAQFLNRHFFLYILQQRAYITAKYAMTLDGKIATSGGESQWITGFESRQLGHQLRQVSDAIIVGAETVLADDPQLTTRLEGTLPFHPVRVILDSRARIPPSARVFAKDLPGRTLLATTQLAPKDKLLKLEDQGVEHLCLSQDSKGRIDLRELTRTLAERHLVRVMVEGGAQVLGSFHDQGLIDEVWAFLGGKLFGGSASPSPIAGNGITHIDQASSLRIYQGLPIGNDFLVKAVRQPYI